MAETILVTGGAGFIGSHLVDRLVSAGHHVRVLDSLEPQVHSDSEGHRNDEAEYLVGTVLDANAVDHALEGVDRVAHLAAQVGVGQSMYDLQRYVRDNCLGTAVFLERLAERRDRIGSLVVAASMSSYGEGLYFCPSCGANRPVERTLEQLKEQRWEPVCRVCGTVAEARPTPESKPLECDSVYAVTKRDQEELCLCMGRAYGIRTVALRFFNVYGPRQSLSNPYTGVAAIFLGRLLNDAAPLVFEDGQQSRDFVHVSDITRAIELSLFSAEVADVKVNIGTGTGTSVLEVARTLAEQLEVEAEAEIVSRFRHGDIRHCFADISLAREVLDFEPQVSFADGMRELIEWTRATTPPAEDRVEAMRDELASRGLVL